MDVLSMFQRPRSVALEYEKPVTYGTGLIYPLDCLVECGFIREFRINLVATPRADAHQRIFINIISTTTVEPLPLSSFDAPLQEDFYAPLRKYLKDKSGCSLVAPALGRAPTLATSATSSAALTSPSGIFSATSLPPKPLFFLGSLNP
ncbi:hypothetical protein PIB30_061401 [Stylosanthes scabra]|uniref:Uncharacterized protein n=1 Tax=Stylosanthes scabra TaxID=79078 RepID=A0ABU6SKV6_9FABA|nr:hypothetical protein [Stylosanthes scabra]